MTVAGRQTRSPLAALPRVEVVVGEVRHRATPVLLQGHAASVVMDHVPAGRRQAVLLRLEWHDGQATTLDARVRSVHANGQVAHFDVEGVAGAWEPFMAYLGGGVRAAG